MPKLVLDAHSTAAVIMALAVYNTKGLIAATLWLTNNTTLDIEASVNLLAQYDKTVDDVIAGNVRL